MDFYGNIDDPVLKSTKRLTIIEPADERPSTSQNVTLPMGDGQFYRLHMRVASFGAIVGTLEADEKTGKLHVVGLALTARELPCQE